jgi:branched-chain amino acid transport system substrate-binding protein
MKKTNSNLGENKAKLGNLLQSSLCKGSTNCYKEGNMRKKRLWSLVLGFVLAVSLQPVWKAEAQQVKPIKIGYINVLTGPAAMSGLVELQAFKFAVNEINKAGGILGHPIEYVVRDDKGNAAVGTRVARELVYNEHVDWLLGTLISSVGLVVSEVARETKTPFICQTSQSSMITEEKGHRYVIRPLGNSHTQAGAVAYALSKKPYKTYTLMASDYAWGHDSLKDFKTVFLREKPDAKILKEEFMPARLPDYSPYITKLAGILPDVAIVFLPSGESETFLKQLGPSGLHRKCLVSGFFLDQPGIEALGKDMPEGVMGFSQFLFSYPGKEADEFRAKIKKEIGVNAGAGTFLGYYAPQFLKAAIEKAGTIEKEAVINAFGTISVKVPQGIVTMRPVDNQGDFACMVGITKFVPEYEFAITVDNEYYPGAKLLPTPEEVMKKRGPAKTK